MKAQCAFLIAICLTAIGAAQAQTTTSWGWNSPYDTDWFNPANWSNGVPDKNTKAVLYDSSSPYPLITTGHAEALLLHIGSDGPRVTIDGGELSAEQVDMGETSGIVLLSGTCSVTQLRFRSGFLDVRGGYFGLGVGGYATMDSFVWQSGGQVVLNGTLWITDESFTDPGYNLLGGSLIAQTIHIGKGPNYPGGSGGGALKLHGGQAIIKELTVGLPDNVAPGLTSGKLFITSTAQVTIESRLAFEHMSRLEATPGSMIRMAASGTAAASFDNKLTDASRLADLANLTLSFQGGAAGDFEVAGRDVGATLAGWDNNFVLGALELGGTAAGGMHLVDNHDNQAGNEALYVLGLQIGSGGKAQLGGLNLYYLNGGDPKQLFMGDANLDGLVNLLDLAGLAASYSKSGTWAQGDFDGDGVINVLDLASLASNYGRVPTQTVPEPATCVLLCLGALMVIGRRVGPSARR